MDIRGMRLEWLQKYFLFSQGFPFFPHNKNRLDVIMKWQMSGFPFGMCFKHYLQQSQTCMHASQASSEDGSSTVQVEKKTFSMSFMCMS